MLKSFGLHYPPEMLVGRIDDPVVFSRAQVLGAVVPDRVDDAFLVVDLLNECTGIANKTLLLGCESGELCRGEVRRRLGEGLDVAVR
jgi:hypothetical protein